MKIWILQTGEPLHIDSGKPRPMRAMNLSNKLVEKGHDVVLWSSAFNHQKKNHRTKKYEIHKINEKLEIRLIPSRGYKKHIGLARLVDHYDMSRQLKILLSKQKDYPDLAFIGYPPIETAYTMSNWLNKKKIPIILDIKDLWPSMFVDVFPSFLRPFARIVFHPYFHFSKKTINNSTSISSMAPAFINWIMNYSKRKQTQLDKVFRLTSPRENINQNDIQKASNFWNTLGIDNDTSNIFFVGTFMSVFDFEPLKIAAENLSKSGIKSKFILCGDGDYLNDVKKQMSHLENVIFPGWVDRAKIEALAEISVASIAPYKNIDNFINNTPNKIVDSLMLGKPFFCPLDGEIQKLIKDYSVGFRYSNGESLSDKITELIKDEKKQIQYSTNAYNLYSEEFEFNKVYDDLVNHIEKIVINER